MRGEGEASKFLEDSLVKEESLLLQKSRTKWLNFEDGNNSFFFNQTKANWNRNKILAIENSEGTMTFGHKAISEVAVDFFKASIGTLSPVQHCDFEDLICTTLTTAQNLFLEQPVTNDLVFKTLKSMKHKRSRALIDLIWNSF